MSEESEGEIISPGYSAVRQGFVIHPDLARHFTDFEDVIDSMVLMWKGKDIDQQFDPPKIIEYGEPIMNEKGIAKVLAWLKSVWNKGIPMANFDEERPYIIARVLGLLLAKLIFVHGFTSFDIKSVEDAESIVFPVTTNFYAELTRPVGGGERNFIKGYTQERHVIGQDKPKGFSL